MKGSGEKENGGSRYDDTISRKDAIDLLCRALHYNYSEGYAVTLALALPSAQTEFDKQELVRTITAGIVATNTKDIYSCGMRNGMRWCRGLLEEDAPKFEDASLYAQLERTPVSEWQKDFKEYMGMLNIPRDDYNGIMQYINELPSAQPERPRGEWIMTKEFDEDVATCPFCGTEMRRKSTGEKPEPPNFCSKCGADLRGNENG